MFDKSVKSFFMLLLTLSWAFLIIFISSLNLGNSKLFIDITKFLNDFFIHVNLSYRFKIEDIANLLRFLEYFFLGIISYFCCRVCFKSFWKNIFIVLFFGLALSVTEMYYCVNLKINYEISNLITSFVEFAAGLFIFGMFIKEKSSRKMFKGKYKKSKYSIGKKS